MTAIENVTVLFTDLVGSTELAAAMTPAAADEMRRAHFSLLRQSVAASGGSEVKNLGDGIMVVFLSTSAALSCAVAMQRAVELDNQRTGRSLALRVGLSVGEATREGDDYFGDPVVVAARLCARAKGGQILAADVVRAMAGRRSPYELLPLGAIELKGMPEAIETLEIGWHPLSGVDAASHTVPMPSRLERAPSFGVVGRQIETAVLSDAYNRVATSAALEVVVITGEAGIGKTVLASQLARTAFEAGACVLLGRCDEDLGVPYGPFVEALGHYVAHAPEELLRSHVEEYGGELAKIVPALARRLDQLPTAQSADPETERYLLYRAVTGLLEAESTARPVALVLDDLQWADKPSLQLSRQLVSRCESMRLLVVGTHRDSDLSVADPLPRRWAALRREAGELPPTGRSRRRRRVRLHGSRGRSRSWPRRSGTGPCRLPRNRRQPVLRRRVAAPPFGDRRHLPRQQRSLDRSERPRDDRLARERAPSDRIPGRPTWRSRGQGAPARRRHRPGIRPGPLDHGGRAPR